MDAISGNLELLSAPEELTAGRFEMVVRRLADDLTYGADASRFVGSGIEYAQTRPFVWGDSVRAIDWRVTARTGRTHVKEYVATKRVALWVVVDTSASMAASSTALSKRDVAVWSAAVLALVGLGRQSPVAVVGTGLSAGGETMSPSAVRGRVWRGVHAVRTAPASKSERLAVTLERIEGRSSAAAVIVVLSDLHERGATDAVRRVAQRHECVVAHLADPAELGERVEASRGIGFVRAREAETDAAGVVTARRGVGVEEVGASIVGAGAAYELVRTDRPLLAVLRRLIERSAQIGSGR